MNITLLTVLLVLFGLLGSGVWIAMSLLATAGITLNIFTNMPVEKIWAQALWHSLNSWALAALPMFIFLGEMILRTRMSSLLFEGLRPWVQYIPGRLLHTNIIGSAVFAAYPGHPRRLPPPSVKLRCRSSKKTATAPSSAMGPLPGREPWGF